MGKVAFISFRLKALDGVSVESEKWIKVFQEWGVDVHRIAGFIPEPGECDHVISGLNFCDPGIEAFTKKAFDVEADRAEVQQELDQLTQETQQQFLPLLESVSPDLLVVENVFSLPLHLPLAVVLFRFLKETKMPCIAVHHDFYWQNPRFSACVFDDLLASHYPPSLPWIKHVTINRQSREELYQKTGIVATCIYNCFDFGQTRTKDDFNASLRSDLGVGEEEMMFLQPTRAIERKGIGKSIRFAEEFARASGRDTCLVVTGHCEEGYEETFVNLCSKSKIKVLHIPGWLGSHRNQVGAGSLYEVHDAYARCDMVTFPSSREGFGNPVLESVVHRKLVIVSNYPVLEELRGFGFQFLPLDRDAVARTIKLLEHPALMEEMVNRNFEIGRKHFSLETLRQRLAELVQSMKTWLNILVLAL